METPAIREIALADVAEALAQGIRDFRAAPLYGLAFGALYAAGGWLIVTFLVAYDLPFLAYPTAMGFALIAPFIAAGAYEVSRRLEAGEALAWYPLLCTVCEQTRRDMGWMALVTGFAFFIWIDWAAIIFLLFFGMRELQLDAFLAALTGSWSGVYFLLLGNAVGAFMAVVVFSITVVSFPLLLDRDIDFVTAMTTSVKAVAANPGPMAAWAVTIGLLLIGSVLTFFIALLPVLPILGFASWHLYRRVVEAPEGKRA